MEGKVSYLSGSSACKSVCSYYQCCVVLQQLALHKLHKTSVSVTDIAALFYVSPITTMGIMQLQVTKDSAEKKKKEKKKNQRKKEKEKKKRERRWRRCRTCSLFWDRRKTFPVQPQLIPLQLLSLPSLQQCCIFWIHDLHYA